MPGQDHGPEIPHGVWEGHEKLSSGLSRPHGFQHVLAENRPLDLSYLPQHPATSGTYVYLALVYPLIDLKVSLWEYYHSQSDIDLRPRTYITSRAPIELHGTKFHEGKEAHRLHWQPDEEATKRFLEFVRTIIFKQEARKRVWALAIYDVELAYPDEDAKERIKVKLALPYNPKGAFLPMLRRYELKAAGSRLRVIWTDKDTVTDYLQWRSRQQQCRFDKTAQGSKYQGLDPQEDDAHPFYKAQELAATVATLWRPT